MKAGRVVLILTCLVVAGLGTWFVLAQWDVANRVATVSSALGAVAAVGVAIWAALRTTSGNSVRASRTGNATARGSGSSANTGVRVSGASGALRADRTGEATASGGGSANTGVDG
ncbi:hypothetical protein [Kibdelosporangium phytohabitans]|uniref:Uncharacterized protein n=1 Tax=Kibdelosporangium phytohabitans TaxID=860235 RepID=A0A0N9I2R0_9PSEU|nr:hypothetical protein [Kibdelosporangium phytohabitans]ALG08752.1 hypothetical protein AOZ06_19150 [Kibdelosporangium phytohabitans]MBE1470130.1 hypothetical protein [Kibdelosporangium phytohabitans]